MFNTNTTAKFLEWLTCKKVKFKWAVPYERCALEMKTKIYWKGWSSTCSYVVVYYTEIDTWGNIIVNVIIESSKYITLKINHILYLKSKLLLLENPSPQTFPAIWHLSKAVNIHQCQLINWIEAITFYRTIHSWLVW